MIQRLNSILIRIKSSAVLLTAFLLSACSDESKVPDADAIAAYPDSPIRVIIPFGSGGLADVTLRLVAEPMSDALGQRLVIENRPGAGGVAATSTMLNADPDGYTLIVLTNGTTIAETLFDDLPYDITSDLTPVSSVTWFDLALLTSPDSGLTTVDDLKRLASEQEGGLKIATINPGSTQNLTAELFSERAGIETTIIPYRTTPDVLGALLRGEVDLIIDAYTALKGAIDGGQAIPVAVTGSRRNSAMQEVPTAAEAGVGNFVVEGWNALYARSGTPPEIIAMLQAEISRATALPEIQAQFRDLGVEARAIPPEAMQARLLEDIGKWRTVIESARLDTL